MLKIPGMIAVSLAALSASGAATAKPSVQYFQMPGTTKPFSHAVRVGDRVYVSGAVGYAADGTLPADFAVEAANAMDKIAAELKLAGATMDDVYKCDVALTNMDQWAAFNEVYKKYFKPERYPVRKAIGASSLRGPGVEVQCEAYVGKRK